ncbi:MAG: S8 family serine peptidase [Planctomycetota bacterium]
MKHTLLPLLPFLLAAPALNAAAQADATQKLAPLRAKPATTIVHPVYHGTTMVVKFRHDSGVHLEDGVFQHVDGTEINAILAEVALKQERLIDLPAETLEAWRVSGEQKSGKRLHDLNLFFRIELAHKEAMGVTCDRLNAYDIVEIAYPTGTVEDPMAPPIAPFVNPAFAPQPPPLLGSPDFTGSQDYREAAPLGVDADYGQWFSGSRGEGILIADVETGWTDDHEDIAHASLNNFVGLTPAPYPWDHGTAVLGELVGEDNGIGVHGIVPEADVVMSSHLGSGSNVPTAIANAINAASAGDVVVLEVQCYGTPPGPFPCEYDPGSFATIQTATANGIHVFAAAGNGSNNLDSGVYGGAFDRNVRDSGAVMVGASDGANLVTAWFSNYGSRLDVHGWGQNVTTTGYGDLHFGSGPTTEYTAAFSGTSSATPIATGAGMMVMGVYRETFETEIAPLALRSLLTATGTPQTGGNYIGPRPDVRAAFDSLGVPTLDFAGNLVPGGSVDVTLTGTAGDPYNLLFSRSLATSTSHVAPFGFLYLGPIARTAAGVIPTGGIEMQTFALPSNPALAGRTIGYAVGELTYMSAVGGGYTNVAALTLN